MSDNELESPEHYDDVRNRVDDLLSELVSVLSPTATKTDDGIALLNGWVSVMSWTDSKGQSYVTYGTSKNLADYQVRGLLHTALFD